jgi:acyl-CoA thioester hydrolase
MSRSTYRLTVRGYELDSFGHVNNAVYLQYSETALWNFFKVKGLLNVLFDAGLFPVVLESTQRYIHELKLMDEVRIDTEVSCSGGIVNYKHSIINTNTGLVACRVSGKFAYVNKERMICDIPDDVKAILEKNDDEDQ